MPQSVLDQIKAAIAGATDAGQRAMLLIMLSLHEMQSDNNDMTAASARQVGDLAEAFKRHDEEERKWRDAMFKNIPAETHVADHAYVGPRRRTSDLAASEASEVRVNVKSNVIGNVVWGLLSAIAAVWVSRYWGG